ncbi:hypothetical protein KKB55_06995 [Myxococcota bacterium]|nr:hypothetical protein [Myxococcota bacterium]
MRIWMLMLLVTSAPLAAQAGRVGASYRGFSRIEQGVFEIAFDHVLLYRKLTTETGDDSSVSVSDLDYLVGITPRYFLKDNLALGLNANFFIASNTQTVTVGDDSSETTSSDSGLAGFLVASYYLRLANSFFLVPGLGAGYFTGTRARPTPGSESQKTETKLSGLAGRFDLGLAFYASEQLNLKAGVDLLYRMGAEDPPEGETGDPTQFTSLNAGFMVGAAYAF